MKIIITLLICLINNAIIVGDTAVDEDEFSLSLIIGAEYNSNITVEELDIDSTVSDSLVNIDLYADYRFKLTEDSSVRIGFDFSQGLHANYSEFDFQSSGLSVGYEKENNDFTTSVDYSYYDTKLDNEGLLNLSLLTPAVSYMVNQNLLLRADYSYMDKKFDVLRMRNATTYKTGLSAFYFLNGAKTYVRVSITNTAENAVSRQLDYDAYSVGISFKTATDAISSGAYFKASYNYSERDYDNITIIIGEPRAEQKNQFKSSVIIPITNSTDIILAYEYTDRVSNLAVADYLENRLLLSVQFSL